jgi:hypothetical protein
MTSFRQIEANRRNARNSTGPTTEEGKQRSRCNAVRHGLTAETVIGALEDAKPFEARAIDRFILEFNGTFRDQTLSVGGIRTLPRSLICHKNEPVGGFPICCGMAFR